MTYKCTHCFEIATVIPCEHCGFKRIERTPEEARDFVLDRMRGGPRQRMHDLAGECDMSYDELMTQLDDYAFGNAWGVHLGTDTPDYDEVQMWNDFELITGKVVPAEKRDRPFSCSC